MAILTTAEFDAADVDANTVVFAGASPKRWALEDVDGDTDLDMILHFRTQETNIAPGDTEACLTGETFDGTPFEGCDSVRTVPPNADIDGDSLGIGFPRLAGDDTEASLATDQTVACGGQDPWPPDVDQDGIVDVTDGLVYRWRLGGSLGDGRYSSRLDLVFDGELDARDVAISILYLGAACEPVGDNDRDGVDDLADSDDDNDKYRDALEVLLQTAPRLACGADAWPPDFNSDGRVDVLDVLILLKSYPSLGGQPRFNLRVDLVNDQLINALDFTRWKMSFYRSCS